MDQDGHHGKYLLETFFSRTEKPKTMKIGRKTFGIWGIYQICPNIDAGWSVSLILVYWKVSTYVCGKHTFILGDI